MRYGAASDWLTRLRAAGPYVLVELLLPGGTFIAALLWLSQRFARNGLGGLYPRRSAPSLNYAIVAMAPDVHAAFACASYAEQSSACQGIAIPT